MKCKLCGKNTQCMCRGGGCKQCWQTNPQVEYTNKVLDLWTDAKVVLENLESMKLWQRIKVAPFLVWDKLTNGTEFPDNVNEAIEKKIPLGSDAPKHTVYNNKFKIDETDFIPRRNPNVSCDFRWNKSPWARCIYCNSIERYIRGKVCPSFNLEEKKEDDLQ